MEITLKEKGKYKDYNYEIYDYKGKEINSFWRSGYIEVTKEDKYCFEKPFFELYEIKCNGGITFSSYRKDNKFYIGFDTMHYFNDFKKDDIDFMKKECEKIIEQLIEIKRRYLHEK